LSGETWFAAGSAAEVIVKFNRDQCSSSGWSHLSETLMTSGLAGEQWGRVRGGRRRGINDSGDVIGNVTGDGLIQPWVRLAATGEVFVLPSVIGHDTDARAINNAGVIVGSAHADHGGHAVIWCRR
jgi:hypothetical protein